MTRAHWVTTPLAVLSSACTLPPSHTALALPATVDDVPSTVLTEVGSQADVAARWQLESSSPWAPYQKMTLLSALDSQPQVVPLPDVNAIVAVQRAQFAAEQLAIAGVPPDVMLVVDLRGAASVAFAATLKREAHQEIAPVLTFNNWPAEDEVIPAEEALAALVAWHPGGAGEGDAARPVFVLDAWRLAFREEHVDDATTDNRYMLSSADLPDAAVLRRHGISRVVYVVENGDDVSDEEDDLNESFLAYQADGVEIDMVDLDWFDSLEANPSPLWALLEPHRLHVRARPTVIESAAFYARARGGFGMMTGVPSIRGGWSMGHGGG